MVLCFLLFISEQTSYLLVVVFKSLVHTSILCPGDAIYLRCIVVGNIFFITNCLYIFRGEGKLLGADADLCFEGFDRFELCEILTAQSRQ